MPERTGAGHLRARGAGSSPAEVGSSLPERSGSERGKDQDVPRYGHQVCRVGQQRFDWRSDEFDHQCELSRGAELGGRC